MNHIQINRKHFPKVINLINKNYIIIFMLQVHIVKRIKKSGKTPFKWKIIHIPRKIWRKD